MLLFRIYNFRSQIKQKFCHKTEYFLENQQYRLVFGHFVSVWHIFRGAKNKKRMNIPTKKACFITQTEHMMKKIMYAYLRQCTSMLCPILCWETLNITHWCLCFFLFFESDLWLPKKTYIFIDYLALPATSYFKQPQKSMKTVFTSHRDVFTKTIHSSSNQPI